MEKPEVITFCVKGFPGTNRSLMNLEKTTGLTKHFVLTGAGQDSAETKFFINYLKAEKPKAIVFGSWSAAYEAFLRNLRKEKIRFGVYWTSSAGQADISEEIGILSFLIRNGRIYYKLFADREFSVSLSEHISNVSYLPATLILPRSITKKSKADEKDGRGVIISLFCSPFEYKRKNILNCLLAVSMLNDDYTLYLNGLSKNKYYKNVLQSLNIRYKDFGWMSESKYRNTLGEIDLGLQVSFAETFNHVAAEHIIREIPVITSRMVPVMNNMSEDIKKRLIVDAPDNSREIKEKIEFLIHNPEVRVRLGQKAFTRLRKENEKNIEIASKTIENILG